jgi:hypothetical protein
MNITSILNIFNNIFHRKSSSKIFCISMQRSGTTSVGQFFQDHSIPWAGWPADRDNNWSRAIHEGDLEAVFNCQDFRLARGFEDSPWFMPGLFKILYHRFPGAKFILLTRDPGAWFASMLSHSDGCILGRHKTHASLYRRELEYYQLIDSGDLKGLDPLPDSRAVSLKDREKMTLIGQDDHYKALYQLHTREVKDFFDRNSPDALFCGSLDDPEKWVKIGEFLGINVDPTYDAHTNKSKR